MSSRQKKFVLEYISVQNCGVLKIDIEFFILSSCIHFSPLELERILTVPIACSELSHRPSNNAVWMALGMYTFPLHQSIRGLTDFSQLTPSTISTLCSNQETVKSVLVVTPASVIGAPCTIPRESALAPFPSSKKVS